MRSTTRLIPRRQTAPGGRCAEPPLAIRGDPQVHTGKVPLNIVVEGGRPGSLIGIGLVIQHNQPLELGCPEEAAVDIKGAITEQSKRLQAKVHTGKCEPP